MQNSINRWLKPPGSRKSGKKVNSGNFRGIPDLPEKTASKMVPWALRSHRTPKTLTTFYILKDSNHTYQWIRAILRNFIKIKSDKTLSNSSQNDKLKFQIQTSKCEIALWNCLTSMSFVLKWFIKLLSYRKFHFFAENFQFFKFSTFQANFETLKE